MKRLNWPVIVGVVLLLVLCVWVVKAGPPYTDHMNNISSQDTTIFAERLTTIQVSPDSASVRFWIEWTYADTDSTWDTFLAMPYDSTSRHKASPDTAYVVFEGENFTVNVQNDASADSTLVIVVPEAETDVRVLGW